MRTDALYPGAHIRKVEGSDPRAKLRELWEVGGDFLEGWDVRELGEMGRDIVLDGG